MVLLLALQAELEIALSALSQILDRIQLCQLVALGAPAHFIRSVDGLIDGELVNFVDQVSFDAYLE